MTDAKGKNAARKKASAAGEDVRGEAGESGKAEGVGVPARTEQAEEVEQDLDRLLVDTKRERDEYLELAQRAKADFENYRKRVSRDIAGAQARGLERIVLEILPVVDNLERALAAAEPRDRDHPESHISEGVRLVHEELGGVLKRAGVKSFDPTGESFDPNWHEAVTTRSEDGKEPGTVLEVLQKGYKRENSILRPARVVVAGPQA